MLTFVSAAPRVRLTKAFSTPFRNVVATARTCYSSRGIVDDADVGTREKFAPLAQSIYEAGHHTTFQHAHFQFALESVSRQFIWSFLHAHSFYNSEQVSQRYVAVKPDTVAVPDLPAGQAGIYRACIARQFDAYTRLCALLEGPCEAEFHRRFARSERMAAKHRKSIERKAQEAARYVLPVATHAYLYHTVSGLTLLRYWRACQSPDAPSEQRLVAERMVQELLALDPDYEVMLQGPLEADAFPETGFLATHPPDAARAAAFAREFDAQLAGRTSRLVQYSPLAEEAVAQSVREVLAATRAELSDADALALAFDASRNRLLGEPLNLSTLHKLSRAGHHAHFTFRKKLSHAADSQDQRHRMTPATRPILSAHLADAPDFVMPRIVESDDRCRAAFAEAMERTWDAIRRLRTMGCPAEAVAYLLPNAAAVRFTESSDFLNLRHKHQMRLCYNAQEEIWQASVDEALQIRDVLPGLGRYLLPPCTIRAGAKQKPICPEGPRFCGVVVWKKDLAEYERVI